VTIRNNRVCFWCDSGFSTQIKGWIQVNDLDFCRDWCNTQWRVWVGRGKPAGIDDRLEEGFQMINEEMDGPRGGGVVPGVTYPDEVVSKVRG